MTRAGQSLDNGKGFKILASTVRVFGIYECDLCRGECHNRNEEHVGVISFSAWWILNLLGPSYAA